MSSEKLKRVCRSVTDFDVIDASPHHARLAEAYAAIIATHYRSKYLGHTGSSNAGTEVAQFDYAHASAGAADRTHDHVASSARILHSLAASPLIAKY